MHLEHSSPQQSPFSPPPLPTSSGVMGERRGHRRRCQAAECPSFPPTPPFSPTHNLPSPLFFSGTPAKLLIRDETVWMKGWGWGATCARHLYPRSLVTVASSYLTGAPLCQSSVTAAYMEDGLMQGAFPGMPYLGEALPAPAGPLRAQSRAVSLG